MRPPYCLFFLRNALLDCLRVKNFAACSGKRLWECLKVIIYSFNSFTMHFTDGKLQNWNVDDLRKYLLQGDIQIGKNVRKANLIQKVISAQKLDLPIQHSQDEREKEILNAKRNKLCIDGVQISPQWHQRKLDYWK